MTPPGFTSSTCSSILCGFPVPRLQLGKRKGKETEVAQSCPTLCDPMDCCLLGTSIHEIFQARVLEWVPFPSPGDLPDPGIKPGFPALQADALPSEPPGTRDQVPDGAHLYHGDSRSARNRGILQASYFIMSAEILLVCKLNGQARAQGWVRNSTYPESYSKAA